MIDSNFQLFFLFADPGFSALFYPMKPKPVDVTCKYCKVVVKKIEQELNNKTAQEDIENCVKHICDYYPKKLQGKCKKFIDEYANEIIKYLPNESPEEVCEKACACPKHEDEFEMADETDENGEFPTHKNTSRQ